MVLIGNNCVTGWCYKALGLPFASPTIWSSLGYKDLLSIIQGFQSIDWLRHEVLPADRPPPILGNRERGLHGQGRR